MAPASMVPYPSFFLRTPDKNNESRFHCTLPFILYNIVLNYIYKYFVPGTMEVSINKSIKFLLREYTVSGNMKTRLI